MASSNKIGSWFYVYGPGDYPNRRIDFFNNGDKIYAKGLARDEKSWTEVSEISEGSIKVEGASVSKRIEMMREAIKLGKEPEYPPDKNFSELPIEEKTTIIKNLEPEGFWRLGTPSSLEENPYFEKVTRLLFYDPR